MTSRRTFLSLVPAAGAALATARVAAQTAPSGPMVDEKDPQAAALGYVADARRVDKAKFPKYSPSQHCAICQFYQGPAAAATAPCTIFAGKRVSGAGWCSAYVAKQTG